MRWLLAHWDLKLVALVLAVALWMYTTGQVHVERVFTVTVSDRAVVNLPERSRITGISPREFRVRVSMPASRADDLVADRLTPRLELDPQAAARRGQSFPIAPRILGLGDDVRVLAVEPDNVREIAVGLDQEAEADLPAELPLITGLPAGLEASLSIDLTLVRVRAPSEALERMRQARTRVRFEAIDLQGVDPLLAKPRQERVALTPATADFSVLHTAHALITVRPRTGGTRQVTMPVEVLGGRDLLRSLAVDIDRPRIPLSLRGPENLLAALRPEVDLCLYVRLRDDLAPGLRHELPLGVAAPAWLSVDAGSVGVTLTPLPAGPLAP